MKNIFSIIIILFLHSTLYANLSDLPQKEVFSFQQGEVTRHFTVYSKTKLDVNDTKKRPAVFAFHGGNGNMNNFAKKSRWHQIKEDIIVIYLEATELCLSRDGETKLGRYWYTPNKDQSVCESSNPLDDIAYLDEVVRLVSEKYPIDKTKMYASGYSNGLGFIINNIIVNRPNLFQAYAGIGSLPKNEFPTDVHIDIPLYISIGQYDHTKLQHSDKDKFVFSEKGILEEEIFNNAINSFCSYLNLESSHKTKVRKKQIRMIYPKSQTDNAIFIFELVKDIGHEYPRGNARSYKRDGTDLQWQFFQNYLTIKKNALSKSTINNVGRQKFSQEKNQKK